MQGGFCLPRARKTCGFAAACFVIFLVCAGCGTSTASRSAVSGAFTGSAGEAAASQPILGYTWDSSRAGLRTMLGVPGAATLSDNIVTTGTFYFRDFLSPKELCSTYRFLRQCVYHVPAERRTNTAHLSTCQPASDRESIVLKGPRVCTRKFHRDFDRRPSVHAGNGAVEFRRPGFNRRSGRRRFRRCSTRRSAFRRIDGYPTPIRLPEVCRRRLASCKHMAR